MDAADVLRWPRVEVVPVGPLRGDVVAPGSKSLTNRLLVVAALAAGRSRLSAPLRSDDADAMRRLVAALGAEVGEDDGDDDGDGAGRGAWVVEGTGGALAVPAAPLDARLSGTTMRFGAALAALAPGAVVVDGAPPLRLRPIGPLTAALRALGADVADVDGFPPVRTGGGGLRGGRAVVDAGASSQFASAVLLVAPCAREDVELRVAGEAALGYVDLTADVVAAWGGEVERAAPDRWIVRGGGTYTARDVAVPADASAAAHLYALAAATGGRVVVRNAGTGDDQPDVRILDVLAAMGATVTRAGSAVVVEGPDELRAPDEAVDLVAFPDQVTTVAALAALAHGTTTIVGAGVTRGHETDRLAALARELGRLGVRVDERPDGLVVHGGAPAGPAVLATHDDHRLAMAFAAVAARVPGVAVGDPGCVAKTYPRFWDDLRALGAELRQPAGAAAGGGAR